jgi:hypothetical protein
MFDMENYRCVTQAGEERMLSEKSSIFYIHIKFLGAKPAEK